MAAAEGFGHNRPMGREYFPENGIAAYRSRAGLRLNIIGHVLDPQSGEGND